jgi:hypothetical protein
VSSRIKSRVIFWEWGRTLFTISFILVSCLIYILWPCRLRRHFDGLRGVISQKIELLITIAVGTSNATYIYIHVLVRLCACAYAWCVCARAELGYLSRYSDYAKGWTTGVCFPARSRYFSLLHKVQISRRAHPASYSVGTEVASSGVTRPGREADHSSPSTVEIENDWAIPPLLHMP